MKRRKKFSLITVHCKRCNEPVTTGNRSLYGLDKIKNKYGGICPDCMTDNERKEMEREITVAMGGHV